MYGEANIFIFNISKIFKRGDADFRFHRFHEKLGDSFSAILQEMDDLVILMDESHRSRAPASLDAVNHLKPVSGLDGLRKMGEKIGSLKSANRSSLQFRSEF
jgi:type III restriction enzyme